jgi:glycosyltransferase involved in cell wall biosynthesis
MKVAIIGPAYPLRGGGMTTFNERLARQFMQEGHEVTIFTFSLQYPSFLFPGSSQYSTEPAPTDLNIEVCINSINPFNWLTIGNRIKKRRPDLVIVRYWLPFMGPCLGTILRRIKTNGHSKIVCIADNVIPHEKRPGDKPFTRYFIQPVDAFITMSEKVYADLQQFTTQKPVLTVPHPLYDNFGDRMDMAEARQHLQIPTDVPLILFFGFIRKYKGLDLLLEAMGVLKQKGLAYYLLIAGECYEDKESYLKQIADLGITGQVFNHMQFITDSDMKYYLSAADVVVQPYRNATQSGVTPLAYHFEVPMIVTNVGGLPALVPDGKVGLVAEPNAAALAEKIAQYFTMGKAAFLPHLREEKKKYSWPLMTKSIVDLAFGHS